MGRAVQVSQWEAMTLCKIHLCALRNKFSGKHKWPRGVQKKEKAEGAVVTGVGGRR